MAGCAEPDNRISLDQLQQLEQTLAIETPVPVKEEQVALADYRPLKIQPRDVLTVSLTGLREDRYAPVPLQLRVHDDGTIDIPGVGPVMVGGLTLGQAEEAVHDAHVPNLVRDPKDFSVFVELAGPETTTILVAGAAGLPGLVGLKQDQRNILYALQQAAAFSGASSGRVRLRPVRPGRPEILYNFLDPNDVRRAVQGPPLETGDMVFVEAADPDVVYAIGLVNAPGPMPVPRGKTISVMRVIAASGGLIDFLDPKEATLWRRLHNGEQVQVKLDLESIRDGSAQDIALMAGDILDVPHTAHTRFREWFAQNIRIGPFGVTAMYDPVADYRARILRNDDDRNGNIVQQTLLQSLGTGVSELLVPAVPPVTTPVP